MPPESEVHLQAEAAEKWRVANAILPILKGTLGIAQSVEYDSAKFDLALDAVENYLPKAISHSDLPEGAQMEFLSLISMEGRKKDLLRSVRRRKQLIAIAVWTMEFGVRVLEYLKVTVHGVPIRQYLGSSTHPPEHMVQLTTTAGVDE